jgi:hypothetical protein
MGPRKRGTRVPTRRGRLVKFTILVADDEKKIREGLAEALRLDGLRRSPRRTDRKP